MLGATCWTRVFTLLRHVGCFWFKYGHFQTWLACRNKAEKRDAMRYVALTCCDRLAGTYRSLEDCQSSFADPLGSYFDIYGEIHDQ